MRHVQNSLDGLIRCWKRQYEAGIRTVIDRMGHLLFCVSTLLDAGRHCKVVAGNADGDVA